MDISLVFLYILNESTYSPMIPHNIPTCHGLILPLSNKPMVGTPPLDFAPAVEVSPGFEGDSACHPGGFEGIPWKIWKLYDLLSQNVKEIEIRMYRNRN